MTVKLATGQGSRPMWSQISDILTDRIVRGEYPVGRIMPGELAVMEEFGVSRTTARQAMERLVSLGYVARMRGKGTVVLEQQDKIETTMQSSFGGILERHNDFERRVVSVEMEVPPKEVAYYFDVLPKTKLVCLRRETPFNGHTSACFVTYLSGRLPFTDKTDFSGSLYAKLEALGKPVNAVIEKIKAVTLDECEPLGLDCEESAALLRRVRMGRHDDEPIEYTYSYYLGRDYELTINLTSG